MARKEAGFTLIELLMAMVILGILVAVAFPSYQDFVRRNKIAEGTAALSDLRLRMEQYYQDNRSYATAGTTCALADFAGNFFNYACTAPTPTTYMWTATSLTGNGLGSAGDFVYTIDQNGNRATTKFDGGASTATCWEFRQGKCM